MLSFMTFRANSYWHNIKFGTFRLKGHLSCQFHILSTNEACSSHLKNQQCSIPYLRVEIKNRISHEDE